MLNLLNPFRTVAWNLVNRWVHRQFPQVAHISTEQLAQWLASDRPNPILIDVRKPEEYAVSHLPGALHLPTVEAIQHRDIPSDAAIVLYCSVGYRSARRSQQLQQTGYSHVMNLEGSLFEWHNQGYPIVANQEPVQQVHPYNRWWGLLLADQTSSDSAHHPDPN
jgi:rhodanese-related sulfurtransferase